ncbi:hypothetical protein GWI33_017003 [Rhynchophorus ferrugineus]|uniref:Uncharacterized protein n=1 Tax=Rhynchophorus ferrugineus TaxID=354439 RepID=A0A834M9Q9_RHYFE|nr:hypothetical protein GWI33_017003 [Rhynchophorus ferrugineus]
MAEKNNTPLSCNLFLTAASRQKRNIPVSSCIESPSRRRTDNLHLRPMQRGCNCIFSSLRRPICSTIKSTIGSKCCSCNEMGPDRISAND